MSNLETRAREIALNHEQVAKSYGRATAMDTTAALIEAEVSARCDALEALALELAKGLDSVSELMRDSYGVDGLHLNGDVAPWGDLRTGGYYESWLRDFDAALSSPLLAELRAKEAV